MLTLQLNLYDKRFFKYYNCNIYIVNVHFVFISTKQISRQQTADRYLK